MNLNTEIKEQKGYSTGEVAEILGISASYVRFLANELELDLTRIKNDMRVFYTEDITKLHKHLNTKNRRSERK